MKVFENDAMHVYLISDSEPIRSAVRMCCIPPHAVSVFGFDGWLSEDNTVSEAGDALLENAASSDALLVHWSLDRAPLINTLAFEIRRRSGLLQTFTPVFALCLGGQEEMISARSGGADEAMGFPLYLPFIQAAVAAHRRKSDTVRRTTARRLKGKLEKQQEALIDGARKRSNTLVANVQRSLTGEADESALEGAAETILVPQVNELTNFVVQSVADRLVGTVAEELILLSPEHDVLRFGALRLNETAFRFHIGTEEVELTPKEFELLKYLIVNAEKTCSRDALLDAVWGIDFETGTNMVEVYMHFLRKKLEAHGLREMIETVRGRGYRLTARMHAGT